MIPCSTVDSHLSIPYHSRLVQSAGKYPLIVAATAHADSVKKEKLETQGVQVLKIPDNSKGQVDLDCLMQVLGEMKIDSILLEGGGSLAEGALQAGIVDKVQFYIAPVIIGGERAKTPVEGRGIETLNQAWKIYDWKTEKIGADLKITGYVQERGKSDVYRDC